MKKTKISISRLIKCFRSYWRPLTDILQWRRNFYQKWPKKRRFASFCHLKFFEQWKICCSNWKFLLKMVSLVSTEDGTRYHFVSIDFHEFEIYGISTLTTKLFQWKNKWYHAFWHLSFIFHLKSIHCGSDFAVNLMISKAGWKVIITYFTIQMDWKNHFREKIQFLTTKFSLFKKQKPANLLWKMCTL